MLLILILLFGSTIESSVSAHTTLGNNNSTPPFFRSNENELNPTNTFGTAHVPGPLGFVWPGSGLNTYTGENSNPPGYQNPFTTYEQPLQEATHSYSPEGAILTSTPDHDNVGDLIFAINFSQPTAFAPQTLFNYSSVTIYIPAPVFDRTGALIQDGFEPTAGINWGEVGVPNGNTYNSMNTAGPGDNSNIVTTITDNYGNIFVTRADAYDPFAPGSWIVSIQAPPSGISFTPRNHWSETYYIRINQMIAPETAGLYFFKMFLGNSYPVHKQEQSPNMISSTMPMENWPVLLVKGEVDPAIVSGTIRYGDLNSTLFGLPLDLPGRVRAVGVTIDPITGEVTGRAVEARGYFNATAQGHFEIEGVAPGVYDLYASAAGYPEQEVAVNVRLMRGQSLQMDLYLKVGPELRGVVYSKENFGEIPWAGQRPISIVIFDTKGQGYYDQQSIESLSPANLTHMPYASYVNGNTAFCPGDVGGNEFSCSGNGLLPGNSPKNVSFPWEGPVGYYTLTPPPPSNPKDPFGLFNGVGPAEKWWVDPQGSPNSADGLGSTNSEFFFQFGSEGVYGVPTKLSGMVPQVFATWTNGLGPGRYYIRVFVNGYVQSDPTGGQFIDYSFDVPYIGAYDTFVPIDLFQSSTINVTVHFHDFPGTLVDGPVRGPDPARYLIAEAFSNTDGTLAALNFTQVYENNTQATISLNGLGMIGPIKPSTIPDINDPIRDFIKYSLARYQGIQYGDYGLPTDTYTIRVYMRGYIQALPQATSFEDLDQPVTISVSVGSDFVDVSTHMYRGGGVKVTMDSIDWETPPIDTNWVWNGAKLNILVYDIPSGNLTAQLSDAIYFWNATSNLTASAGMGADWAQPLQNSTFSTVPYPQWQTLFGTGSSFLETNGSTVVDRFGPDTVVILPQINYFSSDPGQDQTTQVFIQESFRTGFLWNETLYSLPASSPIGPFRSMIAIYPGTYSVVGWTYGYVQNNVVDPGDVGNVLLAVPWLGSIADSRVQLIVGVNFTLSMIFKDEKIISGMLYDSSLRIRIFDSYDRLVAATTLFSDISPILPRPSNVGFFADGKSLIDPNPNLQQLEPTGVPAGTKDLTYVDLAGTYQYTDPGSSGVELHTIFSFDHGVWGNSGYSQYSGSYNGPWTVMIDVVNWYQPNAFYPPVPGLLQGESPYYFPYNHLGPFAQNGYEIISNAPLGGEASAIFELDLRGLIQGTILAMNWVNQVREASWIELQFISNSSLYPHQQFPNQYYWYSWDGFFDGYLDPGVYQLTVSEWLHNEGHYAVQLALTVSPGEISTSTTIILQESGIPITVSNTFLSLFPPVLLGVSGLMGRKQG